MRVNVVKVKETRPGATVFVAPISIRTVAVEIG